MISYQTNCAKIDNFLLIRYFKKDLTDIPPHVNLNIGTNKWNDIQDKMFENIIRQIKKFYPKSLIHILTNEKNSNTETIKYYYYPNLETNHTCKFKLYSLISEPAMYLDSDILIKKPFTQNQLKTSSPFNLYQLSHLRNLQNLSIKKLPVSVHQQFNCGIIWIPRPSNSITQELITLKKEYFNDQKLIEANKAWYNNDEHAVSLLIAKYNLRMQTNELVNAFRTKCKYKDLHKYQSIHYTGVKNKDLYFKEYNE